MTNWHDDYNKMIISWTYISHPDCSCVTLFSSLQPQYNGTYYCDSSLFNGEAYYRRLDCDFVIYRYYSSDWLVGPVLGSNRGALIGLADEHTALADVTSWRAYNSVNGSFTQDAYAYVQCSAPGLFLMFLTRSSNNHLLLVQFMRLTLACG